MPPDLVTLTKLKVVLSDDEGHYVQRMSTRHRPRERGTTSDVRWQQDRDPMGSGAYGQVYLERCMEEGKIQEKRAVKKVEKTIHYKRELQALATLSYREDYEDFFVKFIGWYETREHVCIAMEFHELGSLDRYLDLTHFTMPPESEAKDIVEQILKGLEYMHELEFMHRDLKPANVLVVATGPQWWVKLADFGLTKPYDSAIGAHSVGGSPPYMAPEIYRAYREIEDGTRARLAKIEYTEAVDIWATGTMAYQILAGRLPFHKGEIVKYATGKMQFPTRPLRSAKASDGACDFVQILMTPQSARRPNAKECLQQDWLKAHGSRIRDQTCPSQSRSVEDKPLEEPKEASASWQHWTLEAHRKHPKDQSVPSNSKMVDRSKQELLEASATLASKDVAGVEVESMTLRPSNIAANNAALLNPITSGAAPALHPSIPVTGTDNATKRVSDAVPTERAMAPGRPNVPVVDLAAMNFVPSRGSSRNMKKPASSTLQRDRKSLEALEATDVFSGPPNRLIEAEAYRHRQLETRLGDVKPDTSHHLSDDAHLWDSVGTMWSQSRKSGQKSKAKGTPMRLGRNQVTSTNAEAVSGIREEEAGRNTNDGYGYQLPRTTSDPKSAKMIGGSLPSPRTVARPSRYKSKDLLSERKLRRVDEKLAQFAQNSLSIDQQVERLEELLEPVPRARSRQGHGNSRPEDYRALEAFAPRRRAHTHTKPRSNSSVSLTDGLEDESVEVHPRFGTQQQHVNNGEPSHSDRLRERPHRRENHTSIEQRRGHARVHRYIYGSPTSQSDSSDVTDSRHVCSCQDCGGRHHGPERCYGQESSRESAETIADRALAAYRNEDFGI